MLYISNKGNITGPDLANENNPVYVKTTLERGYHVVVDVMMIKKDNQVQIYLGEIRPQYPIDMNFLQNPNIIARVQDLSTFQILYYNGVHVINGNADFFLTSKGIIWTRQGSRKVTSTSIINMPEWYTNNIEDLANISCAGVCSNFIEKISTALESLKKSTGKEVLKNIPEESSQKPDIPDQVDDDTNVITL